MPQPASLRLLTEETGATKADIARLDGEVVRLDERIDYHLANHPAGGGGGSTGGGALVQDDEPVDAPVGTFWLDTDAGV